ncbi:MAG: 50S ribosomal protein L30 [Candidatus Thermoplasmatota archaeon]|nr:50S ribosomal protein L30 [Candidatus Thermoplasmatota archaeon]
MSYVVVRVRGTVNIKREISDTLRYLNLNRVNHCVILLDNPVNRGMLQKAKDYITWGEVKPETLEKLLRSRGRLEGDAPLTDEHLKGNSEFKNVKELAQAISVGKAVYRKVPGVTPVFRLAPPKSGHGSIKRHFPVKGALGYRGAEMDSLLNRMI